MDDDVIEDLAYAFAQQLEGLSNYGGHELKIFETATYDDILAIGLVINSHNPTYDMRYYYQRSGFPEPYPEHPVQI